MPNQRTWPDSKRIRFGAAKVPLGQAGDKVLQHGCRSSYLEQDVITTASIGWSYESGGETYVLSSLFGTPALLQFQAESVEDLPSNCMPYGGGQAHPDDPDSCPSPTYPPIGPVSTKHAGFWMPCPPISDDDPNTKLEYDLDACAKLSWGEGKWTWYEGYVNALYVREDGYGVDARLFGSFAQGCTTAFRVGGTSSSFMAIVNLTRGTLKVTIEDWELVEQAGETFLRTSENASAHLGAPLRRIPKPPEFSVDPCGGSWPLFGF